MAANKLSTERRSAIAVVKGSIYRRKNDRRCELIDKMTEKGLTPDERKEYEELKSYVHACVKRAYGTRANPTLSVVRLVH